MWIWARVTPPRSAVVRQRRGGELPGCRADCKISPTGRCRYARLQTIFSGLSRESSWILITNSNANCDIPEHAGRLQKFHLDGDEVSHSIQTWLQLTKRCNRNGVNKKYEKWRYISLIKSMVWVIYKQRLTIEKWIREEKGEGRWLENLHKAHERERRIIEDKEWEKAKGVRGRWNTQRHTTGEGEGKLKKHTREGARGQKDSQIKRKKSHRKESTQKI